MASIVHEPVAPVPARGGGGTGRGTGADRNELHSVRERPLEPVRTGIFVGLATIAMTFAALTSALFVREGSANDWVRIALPRVLYFNTLVLLASSISLEVARRRVAAFMRGNNLQLARPLFWLYITLGMGGVFVAGQYLAWLRLRSLGVYLASAPSSSFFYVLTAVHAVHVLGGLGGLALAVVRVRRCSLRRSTLDAVSYYWHFMGALWLYLLLLLWIKL